MSKNSPRRLLVLSILSVTLLGACSTGPHSQYGYHHRRAQDPYKVEQSQLESAAAALREAETLYSRSRGSDLRVYAPRQMKQAQYYLTRAQDFYQKMRYRILRTTSRYSAHRATRYAENVVEYAQKAIERLRQANEVKERADVILADAMEHHQRLVEIGADRLYPREFRRREAELSRLIGYIASGRESRAIRWEPKLLDSMRNLEVKTLDKRYLSQADQLVRALGKGRVGRWAPKTYQSARAALENARAYISAHPREDEKIEQLANEVVIQAKHARVVAAEVQKLKRRHHETAVLQLESYLRGIADNMDLGDMRHMPLREQAEEIANEGAALQQNIEQLNARNQELESAKDQLEQRLATMRQPAPPATINVVVPPDSNVVPAPELLDDPVKPLVKLEPMTIEQERPKTQRVFPLDP